MKRIIVIACFAGLFLPVLLEAQTRMGREVGQSLSDGTGSMTGILGTYPFSRDASGTSWQPDSSLFEGLYATERNITLMMHGYLFGVYDRQEGPRGGDKSFIEHVTTFLLKSDYKRSILSARAMFSLDPLMGSSGYPLLLQTGGTADDLPLIDRQHPQDFFSELSLAYSILVSRDVSLFLYGGSPAEPALGPPVYLSRFSSMYNPEAPISYNWLDGTHVTFGVFTMGTVIKRWKFETSVFRGREPDGNRWNIETAKFDSYSVRASYNLARNWSFQASYGSLNSPEQLYPDVDIDRYTASLMYGKRYRGATRQVTAAWGMNDRRPGSNLNAFLVESAFGFNDERHVGFFRVERVEKDDLFLPSDPQAGEVFAVSKGSLGYVYHFAQWKPIRFGAGGLVSISAVPEAIRDIYGGSPVSYMFFLRMNLIER